jgi:hypothetical protein
MRAVTHRHRFKFAPPVGYAGQGPAHPPYVDRVACAVRTFVVVSSCAWRTLRIQPIPQRAVARDDSAHVLLQQKTFLD